MKQVHRRFLSLLITLIGFLAIAHWVGQDQEALKVSAETESKDAKIFSFLSPLEVDGLSLSNEHGEFELVRERSSSDDVGRWKVVKPQVFDADLLVVEGILAQALPIRRRLVVPNPENLSLEKRLENYGMRPAPESLTLRRGTQTETVDFGMGNAFDKSLYAHLRATNEIVTVADTLRHQLKKSIFDLRKKQLVEFERSKVTSLNITHQGKALEFQKRDGRWSLRNTKMEAPVAKDRMDDLLQDLRALKFNRIIAEEAPALGSEDFPKDIWRFSLTFTDGTNEALTLGLGTVDEIETLLGYREQGGPVGELVRGRWPSLLKGGFMGLVDRRVLPFDLGEATSIEMSLGKESLRLHQADGIWLNTDETFLIDQARIKGLIHTMNSLEQVRLVSVEISLEDAVTQRAIAETTSLRVAYQGESFQVHPQAGEEPNELWVNGQVVQVDATRLSDVLWGPTDYRAASSKNED